MSKLACTAALLVRSIVPVLASAAAVTVVDLLRLVLPMARTPLFERVPPMVTLVPPVPVASTSTVPLLVKPAVIASAGGERYTCLICTRRHWRLTRWASRVAGCSQQLMGGAGSTSRYCSCRICGFSVVDVFGNPVIDPDQIRQQYHTGD